MKKKYNITVNGEKYEVEVELIDSEDVPSSSVSRDSFSIPAAPAPAAAVSRPDVSDNDIPWLQLCDYQKKKDSTVGKAFQVKWIPSMYLIDPKGKVVIGTVMIEKLAAELSKIK